MHRLPQKTICTPTYILMLQSRLILPSPSLRPFVSHYWLMKAEAHNASVDMNIMPMGCMKWMFHRSLPFAINGLMDASNVASVCGQYTEAAHVSMLADIDLIFVFFHPYAMSVVTGMPCSMFESSNVSMDDLEQSEFKVLKQMVLEAGSDAEAIGIIESFIMARLAEKNDMVNFGRMMAVCEEIERRVDVSTANLAEVACLSERQMRRVFEEYVGMSPKKMLRTKRCLMASKAMLDMGADDLTDIIFSMGFTDHSHLNKEFKHFAGMSPTEYIEHIKEIKKANMFRGYKQYHE